MGPTGPTGGLLQTAFAGITTVVLAVGGTSVLTGGPISMTPGSTTDKISMLGNGYVFTGTTSTNGQLTVSMLVDGSIVTEQILQIPPGFTGFSNAGVAFSMGWQATGLTGGTAHTFDLKAGAIGATGATVTMVSQSGGLLLTRSSV
jgi:hypothetical protein